MFISCALRYIKIWNVAVGILQLIEGGRIKYDDTLEMLLDIPLKDIDKDVTVRQLLTKHI